MYYFLRVGENEKEKKKKKSFYDTCTECRPVSSVLTLSPKSLLGIFGKKYVEKYSPGDSSIILVPEFLHAVQYNVSFQAWSGE